MFKRILILALFASPLFAQTTPILQPHISFVDDVGNPCAGCFLYSYIAGSTTATPTYTEAAGGPSHENTNPIVLDTSGSADIWLGGVSYKFTLKDASGVTLWTVDQIPSNAALYCSLTGCTMTGPLIATDITADTVSASVNGVYNVAAPPYNAVGDCTGSGSAAGCTDNHDAIQAAIDAAYITRGSVYFPTNPSQTGQTVYYTATAINPKGVSLFGPPGASGPFQSYTTESAVGIRGGPSKDVFRVVDVADSGYVQPHDAFTVQDLTFWVDSTVDASSSFPYRKPGRGCWDVATTSSSAIITSAAQCEFQPGDVGQAITVGPLTTTIASWQSATQVTLAANVVTGSTSVHTYISAMNLAVTANIGNCAWAYEDRTGAFSGGKAAKSVFRNLLIQATGGANYANNTCGFFFQGNQSPTWTRWEDVSVTNTTFGYNFVPVSAVAPSTSFYTGIADYNLFDHLYINAPYPFLVYSGELQEIRNMQLFSQFGPQLINAYGAVSNTSSWKIDIPEEETNLGACVSGNSFRIAGIGHQIDKLSIGLCPSSIIQWDATSSTVAGFGISANTSTFNLTGALNSFNMPNGSDLLGSEVTWNITGAGNTFTTNSQWNPSYGQPGRKQYAFGSLNTFGPAKLSRGALAFNRTHDFLDTGASAYYFNAEDLWFWPSELQSNGAPPPVIDDPTSETGQASEFTHGVVNFIASNSTEWIIGKQIPAGVVRVYFEAKGSSSFSQSFYVQAPYGSSTVCTATAALTTSYQVFSCDADLTGLAGDAFGVAFSDPGAGNTVDLAWIGIRPVDADLLTSKVTMPGAPAGSVVAADGTGYSTVAAGVGTDYYFTFSGCAMAVSGNSFNCRASYNFADMSPVVPTQPDTNFYIDCNIITGEDWGTSSNVNSQTTTTFSLVQNVDRYNSITATVTPVVWCHLHHN